VVIGSVSGLIPHPFVGVYSSTKAALHSYTEVLRQETSIFGLKVMLVTPGAVQSNVRILFYFF
jgi:1-acylglycerone phosphate reductase